MDEDSEMTRGSSHHKEWLLTCFSFCFEGSADKKDLLSGDSKYGSKLLGTFTIVPHKKIEYVVYGDLILIYPKSYSTYLRGIITTVHSAYALFGCAVVYSPRSPQIPCNSPY